MFSLRVVSILEAWQALENKFIIRELGQSCLNLFEAMNKHFGSSCLLQRFSDYDPQIDLSLLKLFFCWASAAIGMKC